MRKKTKSHGGYAVLYIALALMIVYAFIAWAKPFQVEEVRPKQKIRVNLPSDSVLLQIPGQRSLYAFKQQFPDPVIENLHLPDGDAGRIIRALRFKNVSDISEDMYGLPRNIVSAMDAWEAEGQALLPNSSNDGGFGFSHKQFGTAREFGMKVYSDCKKTICTEHHLELEGIVKQCNGDLKKLIKYDDRFHPVLDHDGTARMIAYRMNRAPESRNAVGYALRKYSGRLLYYQKISYYMALLSSEVYLVKLEKLFNKMNPDLRINGEPADFRTYISTFQKQNYNYGLFEYSELPYYNINNVEDGGSFVASHVAPRIKKIEKKLQEKPKVKKKKK